MDFTTKEKQFHQGLQEAMANGYKNDSLGRRYFYRNGHRAKKPANSEPGHAQTHKEAAAAFKSFYANQRHG